MRAAGLCKWMEAVSMNILTMQTFEYMMGSIILANSIILGAQSQIELTMQAPLWMRVVESIFLSIYLAELSMRLLAYGRVCFKDPWFLFDLILVVLGCSYSWFFEFYNRSVEEELRPVMVLRILRLLRLLRALRMLTVLQAAWRLVYGLLTSCNTMFSTLALVVLMLYIFACLGLELITKDPTLSHIESLDTQFSSIFTIMLTLLQFVTLDSVHAIYVPLIKANPYLVLYFLPILLIISISLMNLVTAVLVEGALARANSDQEQRRAFLMKRLKELQPSFRQMFKQLDKDNSGFIALEEIENMDIGEEQTALLDHFKVESMLELFEVLDGDGSGEIDEEEFVEGLLNLCLAEFNQVPTETLLLLKLMRTSRRKATDMEELLAKIFNEQLQLSKQLQDLGGRSPEDLCS